MVTTKDHVTTVTAFFTHRNDTPGALRFQETDEQGNIKKGDANGAVVDTLYLRKAGMQGKTMKRFKMVLTEITD